MNLPEYKSVIVLDGALDLKSLPVLGKNVPILAADGAVNQLLRDGLFRKP